MPWSLWNEVAILLAPSHENWRPVGESLTASGKIIRGISAVNGI